MNIVGPLIDTVSKTYPPVGRCIYCGAEQYKEGAPDRKLGDEHIIAYSLGGNLILPQASCWNCEDKTKRIEAHITRGMFWPARTKLKTPTRNKKDRPTHLPLGIETVRGIEKRQIAIEDYPVIIMAYYFGLPGILRGGDFAEILQGGVSIVTLPDFNKNLLKHPHGKVTWDVNADASIMGRLLAKTAHAYAVAEYGLGTFKAYLPDLILKNEPPQLAYFVGGEIGRPPTPSPNLYEISKEEFVNYDGKKLILIKLRFFANREGMPAYLVVAGELL